MSTSIEDLKLVNSGKVREIYEIEDDLLLVASDRISIYDVIMPTAIPDKGKVLTQMSNFWFENTTDIVPNHFLSNDVPEEVAGRAVRVRKLEMYPVECVVRGYLSGSGWKEYQQTGAVCGVGLPDGLKESDKLPRPIFTPATKAELGDHDENVPFDAVVAAIGAELAEQVREATLRIYRFAAEFALERGIIIADTKLEFGLDEDGTLRVMDEMLTPDSSRFWPLDSYREGISPPSYDKQFVRDYLETLDWDKTAPGPRIPDRVIDGTRARYAEALLRLTGQQPA